MARFMCEMLHNPPLLRVSRRQPCEENLGSLSAQAAAGPAFSLLASQEKLQWLTKIPAASLITILVKLVFFCFSSPPLIKVTASKRS